MWKRRAPYAARWSAPPNQGQAGAPQSQAASPLPQERTARYYRGRRMGPGWGTAHHPPWPQPLGLTSQQGPCPRRLHQRHCLGCASFVPAWQGEPAVWTGQSPVQARAPCAVAPRCGHPWHASGTESRRAPLLLTSGSEPTPATHQPCGSPPTTGSPAAMPCSAYAPCRTPGQAKSTA